MDVLKQEFNLGASGASDHLRERGQVLEPLDRMGRRAECGVFNRAHWARFMDAPRALSCGMHADRPRRGRRGDRVRDSRDRTDLPRRCPEPLYECSAGRPRRRRTGLSDAANAGEPAYPLSYNGTGEGVASAPPSNPLRVALPWRSRMGAPPPSPVSVRRNA